MSSERTIVLKGDPLQKEGVANATITPGMLIETMSTGKLRAHATQGGNASAMFAIENSLEGQDVDDNYAAADIVQYVHAAPGDEIQAWLADGESVSKGDYLESNGNGQLKKHTAPVESSGYTGTTYLKAIVAKAEETMNLGATSTLTATRIKVTVV